MNKRWNNTEEEFIKQNINLSREQIANYLNRSTISVQSKIQKMGLSEQNLWASDEIEFLNKEYFSQNREVIEHTLKNKTWPTIQQKARLLGLRRTRTAANITFFDKWNDNMAYILGFLAADGCITENPLQLEIMLAEKDKDILIKIRDLLAPKNNISEFIKITNNKKFKVIRFTTASDYMCNRLIQLGITPRKSLTLKFPEVPERHLAHFVRGYFDGDGSIYLSKRNKWAGNILGTFEFLDKLNHVINNKLNIPCKNIRKNKNIFNIQYGKNDLITIGKWLYHNNPELYLNRKYEKFKAMGV